MEVVTHFRNLMSLGLEGSFGSNKDSINFGLLGSSPVTKTSGTNNQSEERGGSMGNTSTLAVGPLKVIAEQEPILSLVVVQPRAKITDLHISQRCLEWVNHVVVV